MRTTHEPHAGTRRVPAWARWAATLATIATLMGGMTTVGTATADEPTGTGTTQSQTTTSPNDTGTDGTTRTGGGFTVNPDGTTTPDPAPDTGTTGDTGTDGTGDATKDNTTGTTTKDDDADKATLTIAPTDGTGIDDATFTLWRIGTYGPIPDDDYQARALTITPANTRTDAIIRDILADKAGDDPTGTLWAQWTGDDHALPTRDTLNQLGDRLDKASRPTQDGKDTDGKADATANTGKDGDATQDGKPTGDDATGTDKPLEPDATHKGSGDVRVPSGWYLVRDDKGTARLAGTLPDNSHAPTDIQLGRLTIKGTPTGGNTADADADAQAQAQADTDAAQDDAAQETRDATGDDTHAAPADPGKPTRPADSSTFPEAHDAAPDANPGNDTDPATDPTVDDPSATTPSATTPSGTIQPWESTAIAAPGKGAKEQAGTKQTLTIRNTDWTTLMGRTFTLWRIGLYGTSPTGGTPTVDELRPTPASQRIQYETSRTLDGTPSDGNATGTLWDQWTGRDGASLDQTTLDRLGDALNGIEPDATIKGAGEAQVPTGWYLIRDDKGTSYLMGTTIAGNPPEGLALGVLTIEGAGIGNLFGLRKATPQTMALQGTPGGGSQGNGGYGTAVSGGMSVHWKYYDNNDNAYGLGTWDRNAAAGQINAAMRQVTGQIGLDTLNGYPDNGYNVGTRDAVNTYMGALQDCLNHYSGDRNDASKCRFVGIGWVTSDDDRPGGVKANLYQGWGNGLNDDGTWWDAYDQATKGDTGHHNGQLYYRNTVFGDGRSVDTLNSNAMGQAHAQGNPSIVIIMLNDDEPRPRYDLEVRTNRVDADFTGLNANRNRNWGVRDHITVTAKNGDWPSDDWVLVCTTLMYNSNDPGSSNQQGARKCKESGGHGNQLDIESDRFYPADMGWTNGTWWSGHYWFKTWVDSRYHWDNGWVPGGDLHAPGWVRSFDEFEGNGSGTEEFWLGNMSTAYAGGSTVWGDDPVYDRVSLHDSHSGGAVPAAINNQFRTFLYVDVDGVKNNGLADHGPGDLQWELSAYNDADQHPTGNATDNGITWHGTGNGTVQGPSDWDDKNKTGHKGIQPKDLRYRDGSLPRCTAPNSGIYDPNGPAQCVLKQWPNGTGSSPAKYTFETKLAETRADRGGDLFHNSTHDDPSESWERSAWGMDTKAMMCTKQGLDDNETDQPCADTNAAPTVGGTQPVHDTARMFDNDNKTLYAMKASDVSFQLHYSPTEYGGTDTTTATRKSYVTNTTTGQNDTKWVYNDGGGLGYDADRRSSFMPMRSPDFTPSDLFGNGGTWKAGYYWFDVWVEDYSVGEVTLDDYTACVNAQSAFQKCYEEHRKSPSMRVSHDGAGDADERFRLSQPRLEGRTEQVANGKSAGNANPAIDKLTLTAPAGSGLDPSKAVAKGVTFTLHYSSTVYGDDTDARQKSKATDGNGATITSPEFTPADLFGKDAKRWRPGAYWFDVDAKAGAISIDGVTMAGLSLAGSSDQKERFSITAPQPVSVPLEALKHWRKGASKTVIQQFQAELFQGDSTDPKNLKETVRFNATNADGTEGKATFQALTYNVNDLGNADSITQTFTIREKPADDPKDTKGVTYDPTVHHATVRVWIDKDGTMQAERKYDGKADAPAFTNTYTPKPTSFPLEAQKALKDDNGTALHVANGQFTFDLRKADTNGKPTGDPLQSKTTQDGGKVTFDPITVDATAMGGKATLDLHYAIAERKGTDPYMEYDTTPHTAQVTITDDGVGQLHASPVTYDGKKGADGTPEKDYVPTVTNTRHSRVMLPLTGGMDPLMLAGIAGTVLLLGGGAAVFLLKRRKHARHA